MIDDLVLDTRAVEKNKLLVELEPSFSLLAARNTSSSEQPNWLLTQLHNRKAIGESIQDHHSIYLDSPDRLTTEHNLIILKKSTIAHNGICFAS
ncbi:MAG: hypothetical protein ABL887_04690 [Nitrosomonas sp.]